MEEVNTQHHSKEAFFYLFSSLFERAGYYGMRVLIVVYMISETINMDRSDALSTYAWFTSLLLIAKIAGAILGDLALGNKKSIIYGGVIQAVGAFCLCISTIEGLYLGLMLIVVGGGIILSKHYCQFWEAVL